MKLYFPHSLLFILLSMSGVHSFSQTMHQPDNVLSHHSVDTTRPQPWLTNYGDAVGIAQRENRPILIYFSGSDWCSVCHRLQTTVFDDTLFVNHLSARLVRMNADFPRSSKKQLLPQTVQQNERLAEQFNPQGTFPAVVLIDEQQKVLCRWNGFPKGGKEAFLQQLQKFVE